MSKAQIKAFLNGINTGKFESQKIKIYKYIKRNPNCTIEDIHFHSTGLGKSTLTARVSDLCDLGVIKYNGLFESRISVLSKLIIVENQEEQLKLYKKRNKTKIEKAVKTLLTKLKGELNPETANELERLIA